MKRQDKITPFIICNLFPSEVDDAKERKKKRDTYYHPKRVVNVYNGKGAKIPYMEKKFMVYFEFCNDSGYDDFEVRHELPTCLAHGFS